MKQKLFKLLMSTLTLLWLLLFLSFYGQTDHYSIKSVKGTTRQIDILTTALELLGHDIGRYPTTQEGLNVLLFPLPNLSQWKDPYLSE